MHPTLADMLNSAELSLTCVCCHHLLPRRVSWVHVAEIEDPSPWLSPGVLLLTTGMFERDEEQLDRYFETLSRAEVAAVGVGVGLVFEEIPDSWIGAAERHGIPLLRVPLGTPYLAISEFVTHRIAESQLAQLHRILNVQLRLAHSESTPALQTESLETLARELDATVLWLGADEQIRTAGDASGLHPGELEAFAGELSRHAASGRRSSSMMIGTKYLLIVSTVGSPIAVVRDVRYSPLEQSLVGSIATVIDLPRDVARRQGFTANFREQILTELLSGRLHGESRLLDILFPQARSCMVVFLGPSPDPTIPTRREPAAGLILKAHLANALREDSRRPAPLLCALENGFALVLTDLAEPAAGEAVEAFLRSEQEGIGTWTAGVSDTGPASELMELWEQALHAHRTGRLRRTERTIRYAQLGEGERARRWIPDAEQTPIFTAWRERLDALSPAEASRTVSTLGAFLRENGALERASAALGVHRQTLNARLRRAQDVLGVSLESPTERALLWLALESGALSEPASP